ncbi:MAG: hypothetical protein ACOCUV_03005 [bacterium]
MKPKAERVDSPLHIIPWGNVEAPAFDLSKLNAKAYSGEGQS